METTVEVSRRGLHTLVVHVGHAGLRPPTDLFDDLAMIGWQVPAPVPPPAAAIDWSTPDETTGERFTVRDYPVVGVVVEPPPGTGRSGAWTEPERPVFERALRGVLERHGFGDALPPHRAEAPDATPQRRRRLRAFGRPAEQAPGGEANGGATTDPAAGDLTAGTEAPAALIPISADEVLVTLTFDPAHRASVAEALSARGLVASHVEQVMVTTVGTYRGRTYESAVPALRLEVCVPIAACAPAAAALAEAAHVDPDDATRLLVERPRHATDDGTHPGPFQPKVIRAG